MKASKYEFTKIFINHYFTSGYFVQKDCGYLLETREEKLFTNMQHRLQQTIIYDSERRILLSQRDSRIETQKDLVMILHY